MPDQLIGLITTPLLTVTKTASTVPLFTFDVNAPYLSFDVRSANIAAAPGQKLAVLMTTSQPYPSLGAPAYLWNGSLQNAGLYAGGHA